MQKDNIWKTLLMVGLFVLTFSMLVLLIIMVVILNTKGYSNWAHPVAFITGMLAYFWFDSLKIFINNIKNDKRRFPQHN